MSHVSSTDPQSAPEDPPQTQDVLYQIVQHQLSQALSGTPSKDYRVFEQHEPPVRMVMRGVEQVEGAKPIYGPDTFEACSHYIRSVHPHHSLPAGRLHLSYCLTSEGMLTLSDALVPEDTLKQLKPLLNKTFNQETLFFSAIQKAIGPLATRWYGAMLKELARVTTT